MPKPLNASALVDRLQSLRPSKQAVLSGLRQGVIVPIVLVSVYVVFPLLRDGVPLSPQQRVEPLKQRIDALDKQIKASPQPSTTDLKEIATLEKGRIDSENTIRTSLFQAVGGLLVFVTLYISWLTLKANEAKQVAERFSKAVEQLGNDNIHVRLGGIYALEQIAKDAEEKYYWQVIETLTSYVRERSPYPPKAAKARSSFVQAAIEPTQTSEPQPNEPIPPLPTDIQAVMTVLARRKHFYGHQLEPLRLDLRGTDLRKLSLFPKAQLRGADLAQANLQGAFLWRSNFQQALLWESNLQGAILREANLREAFLWKSNLREADLAEINLQEGDLRQADLQEVDFWQAHLVGVDFYGANLQKAHLGRANLKKADFRVANLQGALLWGARIQGALLSEANLQGVEFKSVPAWDGDTEIDQVVGLTWQQLSEAASYEGAILPDYLLSRSQQPYTETARSAQSDETLTAALNAIRILAASYKSE